MFCCFQRERMSSIQEFQSVVLNLENKRRMQGKEIGRNTLAHRWCLIHATMPIVFMSEMVLSHLSSMVESSFSSLWLMHGQIVSRENSTGLGHINILLDLSSTRDYRMLLCMIGMMEKILGLWDANSFFPLLMWGVPRFMTQLFQDAMAICRHFHKPDLFLTMTANPKWPEII